MLGYDISWAGFNIIEVMSSNKFTLKRIGYLAASQSFHCDSEVSHFNIKLIIPQGSGYQTFLTRGTIVFASCLW